VLLGCGLSKAVATVAPGGVEFADVISESTQPVSALLATPVKCRGNSVRTAPEDGNQDRVQAAGLGQNEGENGSDYKESDDPGQLVHLSGCKLNQASSREPFSLASLL